MYELLKRSVRLAQKGGYELLKWRVCVTKKGRTSYYRGRYEFLKGRVLVSKKGRARVAKREGTSY